MRILDKRIPTLIGIISIFFGIILTTFLVRGNLSFDIQAGPGQTPKNVNISNISDTSFTVSYVTDQKVFGSLKYGTNPATLEENSLDERDELSQSLGQYSVHVINVKNLSPNTKYYFSLISGDSEYKNGENLYEVKTAPRISEEPPNSDPLSGKVVMPDGTAPQEGIIYAFVGGATLLSSLIKSDGTYIIPFNSIRTDDLSSYRKMDEQTEIKLTATSGKESSAINITSLEINPVPQITLSENYEFESSEEEASPSAEQEAQFPERSVDQNGSPDIITPEENQEFSDQQPLLEGSALPGETVTIEIHSDENIKTQVKANANGRWSFRPSSPLSPGEHTITISTRDRNGILRTITESFTVHAAGSQVNQTATPSATLTPTEIPTPSPTISPDPLPTDITPQPSIPPTGNSSAIIIGIAGMTAALTGIILFLLSRGQIPL